MSPGALSFNYLLFADGSLILLKVLMESSPDMRNILNLYKIISEQSIYADKPAMVFNKNTLRRDIIYEVMCSSNHNLFMTCFGTTKGPM
jgi:hypothetical protein